jgi:hypothetical protein
VVVSGSAAGNFLCPSNVLCLTGTGSFVGQFSTLGGTALAGLPPGLTYVFDGTFSHVGFSYPFVDFAGTIALNAFQPTGTAASPGGCAGTACEVVVAPAPTTIVHSQTGATVPVEATITFPLVTAAGDTTVTAVTNVAGAVPANFAFLDEGTYLDISTTATFDTSGGPIEVCVDYAIAGLVADPSTLRLMHLESGVWVNITSSLDVANGVICGLTSSLSPFGVGIQTGCAVDSDCNDSNPCTTDACVASVCSNTPSDGASCDDGQFCNGADTCAGGTCSVHVGTPCGSACGVTCDEATDVCGTSCAGGDACCAAGCGMTDPDCATCGNNATEGAEECDGGACCTPTCEHAAAGTPCADDGTLCSTDACNATGTCTHTFAPDPLCKEPTVSAQGVLKLVAKAAPAPDLVQFKWKKGPVVPKADFGAPGTSTAYELCVYDETGGVPGLAFKARLPVGGTCDGKPCWTATTKGWKFASKSGGPEGVTSVKLGEGLTAGKSKVQVKAKGNLLMPALPLTKAPRVSAEVRTSTGQCFGARFSTAKKNDTTQFNAKSDPASGTTTTTTTTTLASTTTTTSTTTSTTTTTTSTTTTLPCSAPGLITNGCFELPVLSSPSNGWTFANVDAVGGWYGTGGNPDGNFGLNQSGEVGTDPTVSQTLTGLTVGATYRLTGDYHGIFTFAGNPAKPDAFAVRVEPQPTSHGSPVVLALPRPSPDPSVWTPFTVDFVASASTVTISFEAERDGDDSSFAIDNVALVALGG